MRDLFKNILDRIDILQFMVGCCVMGIFFMLIYALLYKNIPADNRDMVNHAIGLVEGAVIMVVGYYYGSSKGSAMKDKALKLKDEVLAATGGVDSKNPGVVITPEPGSKTITEVKTE